MGKFGSPRLAAKAIQQLPGASVVGDAIGGAVKNINPGLYDLMFNEQTLKQINTGPANKFTTDWKAGLNDGSVQTYIGNKSEAKQADLRKHWEAQDPDQQAFLTNIVGEAATRNSDASIYVNSLEDALQRERLKEVQINKRRGVAAAEAKQQVQPYQTQKLVDEATARKGNQEITGADRSKEEITEFNQRRAAQEAIGSHHHIDDLKFIGNALNRQDKPEVLKIIEELRPGTEFGDRKAGLIGAMDQKTTGFRASARGDISKQIKDFDQLPIDKQKRLLNDLQKEAKDTGDDFLEEGEGLFKVNKQFDLKTSASGELKEAKLVKRKKPDFGKATDPESYGLPRDLDKPIYSGTGKKRKIKGYKVADKWPDGRPVTTDDLRDAYQNRLKRLNIDRKKIKYDSSQTILPKDHLDIIHYQGYNSPKFKVKREVDALMESGEWLTKTPQEAAEMIVEVMDTHRMIVMNVSLERLRMMKQVINSTEDKAIAEVILAEPQNIRRWVEENLQQAANVGWKKKIPTFEELTTPPKLKEGELEEVNVVFATELTSIPEKILSEIQ